MVPANLLRAHWHFALLAPLTLGCTQLARGLPDAATDAASDAAIDAALIDLPDASFADAADTATDAVDGSATDIVDAPAVDRPDVAISDAVDVPVIDRPDVVTSDVVDVPVIDRPDVVMSDVVDVPVIDRPDVVMSDVVDVPVIDRPDAPPADAGACVSSAAARLVRPLSGSRVTTRDLRFSWVLPPGATGARVDFCENRNCNPVSRSVMAVGNSVRTGVGGKRWWRVQPMQGTSECGTASPIWWVLPDNGMGEGFPYRVITDVNADGVGDALVSGHGANNSDGALYVYLGIQGRPPDPQPSQTVVSPLSNRSQFGYPAAGDFDGDGDTDVAVFQVNQLSGYRSGVHVFSAENGRLVNPRALTPPTPVFDYFGNFMFAGDYNADGYTDLAVASGLFTGTGNPEDPTGGRISLYLGSANGLTTTDAVTILSPGTAGGQFGNSGAVVDLNNDGYDDLLANLFTGPSRIWVPLLGGPTGLSRSSPTIDTIGGLSIAGGGPSNLGDVTGDGYPDVGTVTDVNGRWRLLILPGSATGLSSASGYNITLDGSPIEASRLMSADYTGDGLSDFILTQRAGTEWRIYAYPSTGSAVGTPLVLPPLTGQPDFHGTLLVTDFDGNSIYDLVAGHPNAAPGGAVSFIPGMPGTFSMNSGGRNLISPASGAAMGTRIARILFSTDSRVF